MNTNIKIKRFDGKNERIEEFNIKIDDRTTVLEALMFIKDNIDPSLSFRVQCRSAICGTCAVKVGEKHILACKTKIKDLLQEFGEILIEPSANLPVIKDLVVDQNIYLEKLKNVKSWFVPKDNLEPVYPEDLKQFDKETDCILCGICYGVCPAFQTDREFGGPINFVKVFRFWKDKNDSLGDERIVLSEKNHITSCIHCKYCSFMCPKGIPVETDITQIEFYGQQKGIIQKQQNDFGFGFGFPNF